MRLFPIEQKVNRIFHAFIINLTVEVLINDFRPLLCGDIGQNISRKVSGLVDIGACKGKSEAFASMGVKPD